MPNGAVFAERRKAALVRGKLLLEFPDKAAIPLEMTGELLDELPEACPAPCTNRLLMRLESRRHASEVVANEERERLDQERLAALKTTELAREPPKSPRSRGFALPAAFGGKVSGERGSDDYGPANALHCRQLVETHHVLALDANVDERAAHNVFLLSE